MVLKCCPHLQIN